MTADLSWFTPQAAARLNAVLRECTEILVIDPQHDIGLACDLEAGHGGTLHHDPVSGARWRRCLMPDCGHAGGGEAS